MDVCGEPPACCRPAAINSLIRGTHACAYGSPALDVLPAAAEGARTASSCASAGSVKLFESQGPAHLGGMTAISAEARGWTSWARVCLGLRGCGTRGAVDL